jgi:hypothetical protein
MSWVRVASPAFAHAVRPGRKRSRASVASNEVSMRCAAVPTPSTVARRPVVKNKVVRLLYIIMLEHIIVDVQESCPSINAIPALGRLR